MPDINADKVCFVIIKAREFDIQEKLDVGDSNASDDHFMSVTRQQRNSVEGAEGIHRQHGRRRAMRARRTVLDRARRFSPEEWKIAVAEARSRRHGRRQTI